MTRTTLVAALALLFACSGAVRAASLQHITAMPGSAPLGVNYQGRLELNGVPVTGSHALIFKLFDAATGGNLLWTSTPQNVSVNAGLFNTVLPIPLAALTGGTPVYLDVNVDNVSLAPREALQSVPYAMVAKSIEGTIDLSTGGLNILPNPTGSSALYISSTTGFVGIGTTNPAAKLDVSAGTLLLEGVGAKLQFPDASVQTTAAGSSQWVTNSVNISNVNVGNVGIGTTNPATLIDVNGSAQFGAGVNKSTFSASGGLTFATGYRPAAAQDAATKSYVDANVGTTINVSAHATGGNGSLASPWTGWDTAITWSSLTTYYFPVGYYSYTTSPNFAQFGIRLLGEPGTTLLYGGNGDAVIFNGGSYPSAEVDNVAMENFRIAGNAAAGNGLLVQNVHRSLFRNLRVKDVTGACFKTAFAVSDIFDHTVCSPLSDHFTVTPTNGFLLGSYPGNNALQTTDSVFNVPIAENLSGSGIKITSANNLLFLAGTSESNQRGIECSGTSYQNKFAAMDLEANSVEDVLNSGCTYGTYDTILSAGLFHLSGGAMNQLIGGEYSAITIDAGSSYNQIRGVAWGANGTGVITDNGVGTLRDSNYQIPAGRLDVSPTEKKIIPASAFAAAMGTSDALDMIRGQWNFSTTASDISNTVLTSGKPWRVLFLGLFVNNFEGPLLAQPPLLIEVTSVSPSINVGSDTLTLSVAGNGHLQATVSGASTNVGFVGTIHVVSNPIGAAGSNSASFKGNVTTNGSIGIGTANPSDKVEISGGAARLRATAGVNGSVRQFAALTVLSSDTCTAVCGANTVCLGAWTSAGAATTCGTAAAGNRCLCAGFGD